MGFFKDFKKAFTAEVADYKAAEKAKAQAKGAAGGATPIQWDWWDDCRFVAGVTFRQADVKRSLRVQGFHGNPGRGQAFYADGMIQPEPTNPKDKGAMACYIGGVKVGYVAKTDQKAVRKVSPSGAVETKFAIYPKEGTWLVRYWI